MNKSSLLEEKSMRQSSIPVVLCRYWQIRAAVVFVVILGGLLVYRYPAMQAVCWATVLAAVTPLRWKTSEHSVVILSRILFAAGPLVSYSLVEVLNANAPWSSFSLLQIGLSLAWYYLGAGLLWLIVGRRDLATQLGIGLGWVLGMVNHYLAGFRGRTLFPSDLLSLRTALNVADNYDYRPDELQVTTGLVMLLCILVISMLPRVKDRKMPALKFVLPLAGAYVAFLAVFFCTGFLAAAGIEPSMWTTRENGLVLNFSVCLRYSRVVQPDGYTQESLSELRQAYTGDAVSTLGTAEGTRPVNVITIMNESFADLGSIPGVESNQDALPFWHSLTENTVRGSAYSSVFGGTTANSEYEFLTGNTTDFLPSGTVPYHMFVSAGDPSLVAQMETLGYRSVVTHPYHSSGWNRIPVYNDFGFDEALFLSDFEDADYMRGYVSDQSNFEKVISLYEQKEPGEPLFLFNITMQNHGAYNVPWAELERSTWLTGKYEGRFSTVDQYLSLIYQSDRAFAYLIDYFSKVEEPTIVLMFGDHQPQVATDFYTEVLGENPDVATTQRKQVVPFLIWANYDIPEVDGVELSLNYLSTLLMKTAGLPLTGYQKFLEELHETLPVVNAMGYQDVAGNWTEEASALSEPVQNAIARYQELLYNNIFDKKERLEGFFYLES